MTTAKPIITDVSLGFGSAFGGITVSALFTECSAAEGLL